MRSLAFIFCLISFFVNAQENNSMVEKQEINKNELAQQAFEEYLLNKYHPEKKTVLLYPNPIKNHLELEVENLNDGLRYSILDSNGNLLRENKIVNLKTDLNLETLPSGVYLFLVYSESNSRIESFKFIKEK